MNWLDANAEGLALLLVIAVIGGLLLLGALCIERLVEPRHEREQFDHLARSARARRDLAKKQRVIPRPSWSPPSGWIDQR